MTKEKAQTRHLKVIIRDESPANPISWVVMAQTLVRSANILYQNYESRRKQGPPSGGHHFDVSRNIIDLLYGLAIENLVKGLIIAKGVEPFVDAKKSSVQGREFDKDENDIDTLMGRLTGDVKRKFNPVLHMHDLDCLLKVADLERKPNSDDVELLRLLTDIIESGKYPIALDAKIRHRVFPYWAKHSPDDMHRHIMEILTRIGNEMEKYLIASKQWIDGSTLIDLNLGMDS
jgi:hypothetical protein